MVHEVRYQKLKGPHLSTTEKIFVYLAEKFLFY